VGAMLARLTDGGVTFVPMARATAIDERGVVLASSYGRRTWRIDGVDSVVLACGSIGDDSLYRELTAPPLAGGQRVQQEVHLLGDAFAPRRMVFATRQAWELASLLP
jgi:dimethylglycine catabolism A